NAERCYWGRERAQPRIALPVHSTAASHHLPDWPPLDWPAAQPWLAALPRRPPVSFAAVARTEPYSPAPPVRGYRSALRLRSTGLPRTVHGPKPANSPAA